MATPIKDTPTLYGEDAIRFTKEIEANQHNKISQAERDRIALAGREFKVVENKKP